MNGDAPLGVGIIGAGGFGAFVAEAAAELDGELAVVAVTDLHPDRAARLANLHRAAGCTVAADVRALLSDDRVDAVVIATPPSTHAELAVTAFAAGRHVFCEKPAALDAEQAEHVRAAAAASGRVYVVDHVLRYNPVLRAVGRLRAAGLLGTVQRLAVENDAADEDLPPGHWFWDDAVSGGIFVEHGVHFFDAAAALIDRPAESVQAMGHVRPPGMTDTVVCTVAHAGGALATYAHGFSHAHRAERQFMRVDLGLGEARVYGWIPLRADLDVWTDRAEAFEALVQPGRADDLLAVPGFRPSGGELVEVEVELDAAPAATRARGVRYDAPHHVRMRIRLGSPSAKQRVYRESVRAALHDLLVSVRTGATPHADITAGANAVALAAAATRALHDGHTHPITALEASCPAPV